MDMQIFSLLSELPTRCVFDQVVKKRRIRFRDLLKQLESVDHPLDRGTAKEMLNRLKMAQLISEEVSSIEDWNTYFLTADGLEASREMKKVR